MTRIATILSVLLGLPMFGSLAGAVERDHVPSRHTPHLTRGSDRMSAPVAASRLAPAPVPNRDIVAPTEPEKPRTHLTPAVFRLSDHYSGDGYVYGSSPQGMDEAAMIPGIKLVMPLSWP